MDLSGVRIGCLVYPRCVESESWMLDVFQLIWERAGAEVILKFLPETVKKQPH